jgi:hypothetical protein
MLLAEKTTASPPSEPKQALIDGDRVRLIRDVTDPNGLVAHKIETEGAVY